MFVLPLLLVSAFFVFSLNTNAIVIEEPLEAFNFERLERATPEETINFSITLKRSNIEGFLEHAATLSDPNHKNYNKFMTREEIIEMLDTADEKPVLEWLKTEFEESKLKHYGDFVKVKEAKVSQIERMFDTEIHQYIHKKTSQVYLKATKNLYIPQDLKDNIEGVNGLTTLFDIIKFGSKTESTSRKTEFDSKSTFRSSKSTPQQIDKSTREMQTVAKLRELYSMPEMNTFEPSSSNRPRVSIAAFQEVFSQDALNLFNFYNDIPNADFVHQVGSNCTGFCIQTESDLDIQAISGFAAGHETWYWSSSGADFVLGWAQDVFSHSDPPLFHSISYGLVEYTPHIDKFQRTEVEFAKLVARGISIQVSSGDNGPITYSYKPNYDAYFDGMNFYETPCSQVYIEIDNEPIGLLDLNNANVYKTYQSNKNCQAAAAKLEQQNDNCSLDFNRNTLLLDSDCTCDKYDRKWSVVGNCTVLLATDAYYKEIYGNCKPIGNISCAPITTSWPATSKWVTAVGATMLSDHPKHMCGIPTAAEFSMEKYKNETYGVMTRKLVSSNINCSPGEVVAATEKGALITSGAGFSSFVEMPEWQIDSFQHSFNNYPLSYPRNNYLFNTSNRAVPDISFNGHNWPIFIKNGFNSFVMEGVDGTSCASPGLTGFMATLLSKVQELPGAPDGFRFGQLAPLFYDMAKKHPESFVDITVGSSRCLENRFCSRYYYSAHPGWDPASGLGTPNFKEMVKYFEIKFSQKLNQK